MFKKNREDRVNREMIERARTHPFRVRLYALPPPVIVDLERC